MLQPNVGMAFQIQGTGFELLNNTLTQSGNCSRSESRVIYMHGSQHGVIAGNDVRWNCAAWSADVSDNVVVEDNRFTCINNGTIDGGTYIATYDLYHHPSSKWWAVTRNRFSRPLASTPDSWQFHETVTTDAPHRYLSLQLVSHKASGPEKPSPFHAPGFGGSTNALIPNSVLRVYNFSYNMGHVEQLFSVNGSAAVKLGSRLRPPPGATVVALGGSGAGQFRLVTGRLPAAFGNSYTLSAPFDGWLRENITLVAALPTAAQKLIVGNEFIGTSVVQWFGDTLLGVHADNTFQSCNARTGIGGLMIGGALQVGALCYKGAPGQVFFTEYLGNIMVDSDGMALVDNYDNTQMNDCAARGWFPGPWIQWATSRRNHFSGVSKLAKHDANGTTLPRCGAFVQRAMKGYNSTDVIAERTTFECPPSNEAGGYDVQGCSHCSIRE
jgi:hypothetical protein